jgi:hypothetical protein
MKNIVALPFRLRLLWKGKCRVVCVKHSPAFPWKTGPDVAGAMLLEPVLVGLDGERPHQPQATLAIGEGQSRKAAAVLPHHPHAMTTA